MDANRKQAMVPEGAIALDPVGTAPGLVVPGRRSVVVVLPGPPRELQPMWPAALETAPVRDVLARATPLHGYTMRMFGIPESEIAKSLREIEDGRGGALGGGDHHLPAARRDRDRRALPRRDARRPPRRCGPGSPSATERHLFSVDGETIDSQVARLLQGRRLGLAESCSGGLLAARITDLPGASAYMAGSVVAYSNEAKAELLGVDPALIEAPRGGLARGRRGDGAGALERFEADVAVSITGIAGPAAAARRSRSATSASTPASPTDAIARDPVIPGGRATSANARPGRMHLLRICSGRERRRSGTCERSMARSD